MQYIRYHEMENLLKKYKDLEGATESIKLELYELQKGVNDNEVDDFIEGLALRRSAYDDIKVRVEGHISDKTASIAMDYREKLEKENKQLLMKLQEELLIFQVVLDKLDIGLRVLPEEAKEVIKFKYFDNLTWYQIEGKLLISKSQGQDIRKKAIGRLLSVCRITINQYEEVMKLLDFL